MIYVENDFYSNFTSVSKSSDDVAMRNILIDQLSNVVVNSRDELIDLLKKSNIKTSKKPSNKELSDLIVKNLKTNKKLVVGLAFLIAKQNDILQMEIKKDRPEDIYSGQDGKETKSKKERKIDWSKGADTVTSLAGAISIFADTLTGAKQGGFANDLNTQVNNKSPEQLAQEAKDREEAERLRKRKKRNRIIIGVIVGLAIAGGVFYAYKKGVFSKKSIE